MEPFSEYLGKDNRIARVDARVKILIVAALLVMVLSSGGSAFPLLVALFSIFLCLRMEVPARVFLLRFSEPLFLASVLLLLKFLFTGREVLFSMDIAGITVTGYRDGLMDGVRIASRIMGAVSLLATLGFATPFIELMAALAWFRVPRVFVELLMLTYRYIFVLLEEALVIYHAQKNRLGYSGLGRGLRSFGTLSGELTLRALEQSRQTAMAMVQRGYTGEIPMGLAAPLKAADILLALVVVLPMGALWMLP